MERINLKGTGVALITPFNEDKSVDYVALEKLVEYVISNGVDYLVALGTTAEAATLTLEERCQVVECIKKVNANRLPVVIGIGGNNTESVINAFGDYNLNGIDAILSVTPYYNKPNQEGLYQHYKALAEKTPLPIILYNVPGRTGVNLSAETTLRLAKDFKNIVAVKDASGNLEQTTQILAERPDGFKVFSGDDALTLPMIALGADGVISVVGQGMPAEFTELVNESLAENYAVAQKQQYRLINLIQLIFKEGNPAGIKAVLFAKNIVQNELRLPLVKCSDGLFQAIKNEL